MNFQPTYTHSLLKYGLGLFSFFLFTPPIYHSIILLSVHKHIPKAFSKCVSALPSTMIIIINSKKSCMISIPTPPQILIHVEIYHCHWAYLILSLFVYSSTTIKIFLRQNDVLSSCIFPATSLNCLVIDIKWLLWTGWELPHLKAFFGPLALRLCELPITAGENNFQHTVKTQLKSLCLIFSTWGPSLPEDLLHLIWLHTTIT